MLGAICSSCNKWQAEGTNKKLEQSKQKKKKALRSLVLRKKNLLLFWVKVDGSIFASPPVSVIP